MGWAREGPTLTCPRYKAALGILSAAGTGAGRSYPQFLGTCVYRELVL